MFAHRFLQIVFLVSITIGSTVLAATWYESFVSEYRDLGLDQAVKNAVKADATPNQIIQQALPIDGIDRAQLIKALLCANAKPNQVEKDAKANKIVQADISEGESLAMTECRRIMEENLNWIPPGKQGGNLGGNTSASPHTFFKP